jgi:creatinine amidohydrolase
MLMLIEAMTMTEFQQQLQISRTVLIPVGSVEEHGLHLPLGTDTIHAFEVCRQAGARTGALVAPPVYYGVCRSTSQHPGTLSISGDTLRALIMDIGSALYQQGLRQFVILSGHAGGTHSAALIEAGEALLEKLPEARIAALNILDLGAAVWEPIIETKGDAHAGELETSVLMALRPSWVKGTSPEEYPSFPKAILVRNKRKYWPGGVWGDPARASLEKGTALLEAVTGALVQLIQTLETEESD